MVFILLMNLVVRPHRKVFTWTVFMNFNYTTTGINQDVRITFGYLSYEC